MEYAWVARGILFLVMFAAGVLLFWMADAAASGRLKRNPIAGIRTPSTMASDEAWRAAHVRARPVTRAAGIVSVVGALLVLVPFPLAAVNVCVVVVAVIMLALVLYGARVGAAAARSLSSHSLG